MNRREFLRSVVGGGALVAAGLALPFDSAAVPAAEPLVAEPITETFAYQKYVDALRLMDQVLSLNTAPSYSYKRATWSELSEANDRFHEKIDELMEFVYANWAVPKRNKENLKAVEDLLYLSDKEKQPNIRSIPPEVIEEIWPILLVKTLLRDYQLPINHRKMKSFQHFHDTYGWFILGGDYDT
jgi:hypothetical protein